jgi:hypothetical protein
MDVITGHARQEKQVATAAECIYKCYSEDMSSMPCYTSGPHFSGWPAAIATLSHS